MTKTVLILTNSISGLHNFRREVVKAICDDGYKVIISVPEDDFKAAFFRDLGCDIVLTKLNRRGMNPIADISLFWEYRRLMNQHRPIAVLTYTIKPNIYGGLAARFCRIPQLANITGLGDALENGGWLQRLTISLYKIGLGKAQQVFFQNKSNQSFCIKTGIAKDNSILLPGSGVNLQHHTYQKYPANDGVVRFLFIGRILKDKGVEELFNAAKLIKEKYPNSEFQIIGSVDGRYQETLNELEKDGVISFLGRQSDVRPYLGAVECTIMPSYHEGMSNVNLESAANGRPVITTDVPGCRETVDDGLSGYLVKARNVESLVETIERFILLPYSQKIQMGIEARKKVEREFDRQIVVDAYLKEIRGISHV